MFKFYPARSFLIKHHEESFVLEGNHFKNATLKGVKV